MDATVNVNVPPYYGWNGGKWFTARDFDKVMNGSLGMSLKAFTAGGSAGAVSKTVVAPLERVKLLRQIESMNRAVPRTSWAVAKNILSEQSLAAFWRGNGANCIRIVPNKGIMFMTNDIYLKWVTRANGTISDAGRLFAGSASGVTLVTFTYPLDIAQSRLASSSAAQYTGVIDVLRSTAQKEGMRGVYKGYVASVLGVAPYVGSQFFLYNKFTQKWKQTHNGSINTPMKLVSGAVAGAIAQSVSFPADTVRRRLQVQGQAGMPQLYSGTWDCFRSIYKAEGIRGFYRGVGLNAIRAAPSQAVQFWVYTTAKSALGMP